MTVMEGVGETEIVTVFSITLHDHETFTGQLGNLIDWDHFWYDVPSC